MNKLKRHFAIKEIITSTPIGSQEGLARALYKRGIHVTQATLSRDLNDLGIIRVPTRGRIQYALPGEPREDQLRSIVSREVVAIKANESVILINTIPGRAQGVARFLDSQDDTEILGTVAGDDTVIVVPRSVKRLKKSFKHVEQQFSP